MADTLEAKLHEIRALFPLKEEDVERFDELRSEIADTGDRRAVRALIELFDDDCPLGGVMESLLGTFHVFSTEVLVPEFLAAFPDFAKRNPLSCSELLGLILARASAPSLISCALKDLDTDSRARLVQMLSAIRDEKSWLQEPALQVLSALSNMDQGVT